MQNMSTTTSVSIFLHERHVNTYSQNTLPTYYCHTGFPKTQSQSLHTGDRRYFKIHPSNSIKNIVQDINYHRIIQSLRLLVNHAKNLKDYLAYSVIDLSSLKGQTSSHDTMIAAVS